LIVIHPSQEDHNMPAPLSLDIRRRFRRCIEAGFSGREAARRLMLSAATGTRLAKRVRRNEPIAPKKCGRPVGCGKLGPHKAFLLELVDQDPDITMGELQAALIEAEAVRVHESSLSRALRRFGYTYKKSRWWRTSNAGPMSPRPVETG
jgi:transposase